VIANLQDKAKLILSENASAILTATGVVGTVGTAVLTGRASFKAAAIIQEKKFHDGQEAEILDVEPDFDRKDAILAVWPCFVPPVVLGGGTIVSRRRRQLRLPQPTVCRSSTSRSTRQRLSRSWE
jgi:hypothetical protein